MKSYFSPSALFAFSAYLCAFSMLYSPFLLSVSMWGMCAVALWQQFIDSPDFPFWPRLKTAFGQTFSTLFQQKNYLSFTLLFFVVLLSGLWSGDTQDWLGRARIRIPFFVLPWAFANAPKMSKRQLRTVLWLLLWTMFLTCLGVGINYLLNREEILLKIYQGQSIPVPRNHIRFSLVLAFCALLSAVFFLEKKSEGHGLKWYYSKPLSVFFALFFFAFAHFLAVRSGLFALYFGVAFLLFRAVLVGKKWVLGLGVLAALPLLFWTARKALPTLSRKVDYMMYDFNEFREGRAVGDSDSGRWASYSVALEIWKNAPFLGVGSGDLKASVEQKTAELYPQFSEVPKMPHNQYLYILSGTGILGLLLSLLGFFYFFREKRYRSSVFCVLFALVAHSSFLAEYTIETAIGVAFYLFFTLFLMKWADE